MKRVPSSSSGCPYAWPLTGVDHNRPNVPPLTSSGVIDGSFGYHPVRRSPPELVNSTSPAPGTVESGPQVERTHGLVDHVAGDRQRGRGGGRGCVANMQRPV